MSDCSPTTVLSASFAALLDQSRTRFALTVNGGPRGSFTAALPCFISPHVAVDICLGLDWKASVREWLIGLGENPRDYLDCLHAVAPGSVAPVPLVSGVPGYENHSKEDPYVRLQRKEKANSFLARTQDNAPSSVQAVSGNTSRPVVVKRVPRKSMRAGATRAASPPQAGSSSDSPSVPLVRLPLSSEEAVDNPAAQVARVPRKSKSTLASGCPCASQNYFGFCGSACNPECLVLYLLVPAFCSEPEQTKGICTRCSREIKTPSHLILAELDYIVRRESADNDCLAHLLPSGDYIVKRCLPSRVWLPSSDSSDFSASKTALDNVHALTACIGASLSPPTFPSPHIVVVHTCGSSDSDSAGDEPTENEPTEPSETDDQWQSLRQDCPTSDWIANYKERIRVYAIDAIALNIVA
ncbi:hypothetical protein C8R47DRAFT_1068440 [Mycena vitilis]|nr:hypothetical protein C8R47DRAFT_1068440 [Mycena vitilis]